MKPIDAKRVINGTFGELWVDNDEMHNILGMEAKASLDVTEIKQCGTLEKGYKVTGITGSGTLKLNKVNSYFVTRISEKIKNGEAFRASIISNLADPEAFGAERVKLTGCIFTEVSLAAWEASTMGEESIPFNFSGWEVLEAIE